jgi:virginiamycin B lyase
LTARLNGVGHTDSTHGHFEFQYSTAANALGTGFGLQTPTRGPVPPNVPGNNGNARFGENVGGLSPGTTYYYRMCGGDGQVHPDACADTRSFTTASSPSYSYYRAGGFGIVLGSDRALWSIACRTMFRVTTAGEVTPYSIPTDFHGTCAAALTSGPDGALWFLAPYANVIGRMTTAGSVTATYSPPTADAQPSEITSGPDGALWFTEYNANKIGRITTNGTITEYPVPTSGGKPLGITSGPDNALWFTEHYGKKIGRITTAGAITEYPLTNSNGPSNITAGPDGALWFANAGIFTKGTIGRITTAGTITEYPNPVGDGPGAITTGPDGALWYTANQLCGTYSCGGFARITTNGQITRMTSPLGYPSELTGLVTGPDGALWLADYFGYTVRAG